MFIKTTPDYRIGHFKHGVHIVHTTPDGTGFKTRAARLADACGGRWTHKHDGYSMTEKQAIKFSTLFDQGWDGCSFTRDFRPPKTWPQHRQMELAL